MLDKIFVLGLNPRHSLPPPSLGPVKADGISFNVPGMTYRDYHIFLGDQVLYIHFAGLF